MATNDRDGWERKAAFMRDVGATEASWQYDGELMSLKLAPQPTRAAQPTQPPTGPAARTAAAFADRMKREHEVRFAASHFKPRLDAPQTQDDVPRAVRARSASDGGTSNKSKRR